MLTLSGSTATRANFASSIAGFPVGMATGPMEIFIFFQEQITLYIKSLSLVQRHR
jgi:hypothetical protein